MDSTPYQITFYQTDPKNQYRFGLGIQGSKPLIGIGLNPSTADDQAPDQTIRKIRGYAFRNGFDGFYMLNLYPQRTPFPSKLHLRQNKVRAAENLTCIQYIFTQHPSSALLACWGSDIERRAYLWDQLQEIVRIGKTCSAQWFQLGSLTKAGHPRHPARTSYALTLSSFEIEHYLDKRK